jgi:hypothetical protein
LNKATFPHLFHVYLQSRGARPSTAQLEAVFSLASNAAPDQRMSMSTKTLNHLLVLKTSHIDMVTIKEAATGIVKNPIEEIELDDAMMYEWGHKKV